MLSLYTEPFRNLCLYFSLSRKLAAVCIQGLNTSVLMVSTMVLRSILFILYLNDIFNTDRHGKIKQFVDDTMVYFNCSNILELVEYLDNKYLRIGSVKQHVMNTNKCKPMAISNKCETALYDLIIIINVNLEVVHEIKFFEFVIRT